MNLYWLIPFFAIVLLATLNGAIISSARNDSKKYGLLIVNTSLLLWACFEFIIWIHPFDAGTGLLMEKILSIFWLSIGLLFLKFVYALLNRKRDFAYYVSVLITLTNVTISLSSTKIVTGVVYESWGAYPHFGEWILAATAGVLFPMFTGMYFIIHAFRTEKNVHLQKIYRIFLIGVIIAVVVDVTFDVVLPVIFNTKLPSMSAVGNATLSLFLLWIVNRYHFLELAFEDMSKTIFDKISDGIVIAESNGDILMMNQTVKDLLNNHKNINEIIDPAESNSSLIKTKITNQISGESKYMNISNNILTDHSQRQLHLYVLNDVSELVKYRNSLIDKNEEFQITLYRIGHDIKGPAGAIKQLVLLAKNDKENTDMYLDKIDVSINQLSNFISEVERLIRLKEAQPATENIDLNNVITRCWEELEFFRQNENHQLFRNLQVNNFKSDPLLVYSIILNILSNAIKYHDIKNKGVNNIGIHSRLIQNRVEIEITDSGMGMNESTTTNIYKLFYRGNNSVKGAGLGMYIVKTAIENLKGDIQIKSEPGKGTCFKVSIPVQL